VWTANTIIARSARARPSNTTNGSSIYAVEVPIFLQRTVIRRIGTRYTIKETPGGITAVALQASSTVWITNTLISAGAGAITSKSTDSSSIYAIEVPIIIKPIIYFVGGCLAWSFNGAARI
jgi:hypothetical protein